MPPKKKLIRVTTSAESLDFLKDQLRWLNKTYNVVAVSSGSKKLHNISLREGIQVKEVAMARHISILQDTKSLLTMIRVLKKEKPFIVHSMTPKAGLISMVAAKIVGVPIRIHTFTGLVFPTSTGIKKKILIFTDKITCLCATKIIPEGNGVKKDLISNKITNKKLNIIHNGNVSGIDTKYFDPELFTKNRDLIRKNINIIDNDFVFIFIGRLVKDKGINELVTAFKNINYKNAKLLLVGKYESELDPLFASTIDEIKRNPNILEIGYQNDIRPWLSISDALVFPSYREGFPNVVLEAGAMGLPSIVTDINGSNEIIRNRYNGIIIPPKDCIALEKTMKIFMTEREQTKKYASNSRNVIVSRFRKKDIWNETLRMYKEEEQKFIKKKKNKNHKTNQIISSKIE